MNQLSHYTPCLSPLSGSVERNQQGEKELGRLQAVPSHTHRHLDNLKGTRVVARIAVGGPC